ncbi:Ig-like domain-containing protein [Pedobacter insulae]|uniref:Ig-like domain-containing protein n=2 Tax=Pedobacter insulae TaxID=414048 RepID=A0A1I2XCN4_9SPHI|nr:Ig-like domain-containing protein [Pedobacter insulae]
MPSADNYWKTLVLFILCIYGCASMRNPEGGPVDKTPPKVLKMEPKNLTTNFNSQKIVITFDEYFNIQNESKEFSVSPEQERPPLLKKDGKKLEIIFQDSLEKNTTYTLNFGKAIADIHESNVLKNLTYAFSTGAFLDSLSISGKVTNLLTGKPEIDATVFILPLSRDSIFGKKRASISTSTDSSGYYSLKNLKKDTYKIYALKETAGDKVYQQRTDEIGFVKEPIILTKDTTNVDIGVFKELAQTFRIVDRKLNNDGSISMIFNQQLSKPDITVLDQKSIDDSKLLRFSQKNDSLRLWLQDLTFDSVRIELKNEGKSLDTIIFNRDKKDTYARALVVADNLEIGMLNPYRPYRLIFNFPIENVDLTKIKLTEDSIPRTNFTFSQDSTNFLVYNLNYPWRKKAAYSLLFAEGAITGIFGVKNKEFKKTFKLASADDYGTFVLKIEIPDTTKSYVLEILNEKKDVVATEVITKNRTIKFANYRVATYATRIIYDENKNGKWDTGSLALGTQPEKTFNNPQEIALRANWEQIFTWAVPPPPSTTKKEPEPKPTKD